jgi:DnaJ-domain-containing protein 1
MIKRLYNITRASINDFLRQREQPEFKEQWDFSNQKDDARPEPAEVDPLAQYYSNLELQPGANREAVHSAWKRLMKKYHPDLHETDPKKIDIANELTRKLTEAYQILDKELSNKR